MSQIEEILDFHRRMFGVKDKDFNVQLKQTLKSLLLSEAVDYDLVTHDFGTPQIVAQAKAIPIDAIEKLFGLERDTK